MDLMSQGKAPAKPLLYMLSALRILLVIAILFYCYIETIETMSGKEILHLTMFAAFFLLANLELTFCRVMLSIKEAERAQRFTFFAVFMISAALLEIFDAGLAKIIGFEQVVRSSILVSTFTFIEFAVGLVAVAFAAYSLDRLLVTLKSVVKQPRFV
ncbi:MAG: hypothetical protein CL862_06165 [Cyanobium sp. NAT70]|nr:hypothetical protein [Cyanobium sp. NAT70]|tara:strand:- start:3539 stop:4009 length:471 start_codon:yes stop_codon:yes gene_type:complete